MVFIDKEVRSDRSFDLCDMFYDLAIAQEKFKRR